jgi:2-polyprenyl-3-methyl-5-hydroxy-6-metoxy-1,4-benzoquinol methylase
MPLSKVDKVMAGGYVILNDFAAGIFPPRFEDQAKTYQGEIDYDKSIPGESSEQVFSAHSRKPFWNARSTRFYIEGYLKILEAFERYGIVPPQRILELGCGSGWTCEFLALNGYAVVGTTIAPFDIDIANRKKRAMEVKGLPVKMDFEVAPMETVEKVAANGELFDAAFIYEALHHAFDWREALTSASKCLKPGGFFLVANEPNRLHTFISYRVAKLSNTHEIGMSKPAIVQHLRSIGFTQVDVLQPRLDNFYTHIWIMARKG